MGNLIEHGDVLFEVIDHLVCGTDFQALLAVNYERGKGCRK